VPRATKSGRRGLTAPSSHTTVRTWEVIAKFQNRPLFKCEANVKSLLELVSKGLKDLS
jgi:hypothetical protein